MSHENDTISSSSSWVPYIPPGASSSHSPDPSGTSTTRPFVPNLTTSFLGSPGLGDPTTSPNRPFLGRSATSPHLHSVRNRRATFPRLNTGPHTPREWSVFGQLMENEGQLTPKSTSSKRPFGRNRPLSQDSTRRESLIDSFASLNVQSPVAEEVYFNRGRTPADSESEEEDESEYASDSDESAHFSPAVEQQDEPRTTKWYHFRQKLPNVPVLHRNIFKCAVAYFIASLFTFNPYLAGFMSDLVNYGSGTRKPLPSGHMVATVAVYFNPAKSMGGMIEADFFFVFGVLYSAFICLSSMTMFWWLDVQPGWEWLADLLAIVWVGVGMSFLAWMKVYMANPQFNTACSMMAISIFVVLVKEGGLHQLLQVTFIVFCGIAVSNLVCYFLWPQSATDTLRTNMAKTIDSFSTLLSMLTETFLLEEPVHTRSQGRIQRAVEAHQSSFTGLRKSLKEAGVEWIFWGRLRVSPERVGRGGGGGNGRRRGGGRDRDGDGDGGRKKAYEDAVDSLNRLAQHLNGLRSGTRLQYELTQAGAVARRARKGKHGVKTGQLVDVPLPDAGMGMGTGTGEEDDEEAAMLKAAAVMFGDLVDDLGPPMKALSNTCTNGLKRLKESFLQSSSSSWSSSSQHNRRHTAAFNPTEFNTLIDSIEAALLRFESTSNHAVMRLYRKSDLVRVVHQHHASASASMGPFQSQFQFPPPQPQPSPSHSRPPASERERETQREREARVPATPVSVRSTRSSTTATGPGTAKAKGRGRSGTVVSLGNRSDNANVFLAGEDGTEHIFLVYFFIFTLQEFAREMTGFVDAMERIYAVEAQRLTWRRWSGRVYDTMKGKWEGWRESKRRGTGGSSRPNGDDHRSGKSKSNSKNGGGLRKRLSRIIVPQPTNRTYRPQFPKVTPHAPDTIQTPSRRNLSFVGRVGQGIWSLGKRLNERDTKFAVKAGMATAILAAPAFFERTRGLFVEYYGDWALISFFVVMSPTIGATNFLGLHRILATLFGAAVAAGAFSLFPENAIVLSIFGFFFSIPCFYYLVGKPVYASAARFVLLTYNLTGLYCYNLRAHDLSIAKIAYHRAISVTVGVVWAGLVSRFWWPAEARRELSKALGEFCLNMGWLYTRLVQSNSFTPEYSDDEGDGEGEDTPSSSSLSVGEGDGANGNGSALAPRVNGSIKEFMAMELHLQIKLIEIQGLLAQAQHEPRLKGPFPVGLYRGILTSLQGILDKLHSMRCVTTREEWYTSVRQDFIIPVNKERRDMAGNIILFFSVLASAFRLKAPLPPYLPPAEESRQQLVNAIRNLEVVRNRDVKGSKQLLFFAYAMAMRGVTNELGVLGRILQDAFGVIGQSTEEFERLFFLDGVGERDVEESAGRGRV
ncbi:hypothetical protein GYMLUDRAFT_35450 [Collybiopsis luxurians FD-317 M1]|nr:hypothetical protein GYMLUDRAFT_35450 [Collybiopsis luxurians FD-317 M1]